MALIEVTKHTYAWSSRLSTSVTLLFTLISLIIHIHQMNKHQKLNNISKLSLSLIFSVILHISIIIQNIFTVWVTYIETRDTVLCDIITIGASTSYMIVKWTLYMLLSFRIGEVFHNSAYGYSKRFLLNWRVFMTVGSIIGIIANGFTTTTYITDNLLFLTCDANIGEVVLVYVVIFDSIVCFGNLLLFVMPLNRLNKSIMSVSYTKKCVGNASNNNSANNSVNNSNTGSVQNSVQNSPWTGPIGPTGTVGPISNVSTPTPMSGQPLPSSVPSAPPAMTSVGNYSSVELQGIDEHVDYNQVQHTVQHTAQQTVAAGTQQHAQTTVQHVHVQTVVPDVQTVQTVQTVQHGVQTDLESSVVHSKSSKSGKSKSKGKNSKSKKKKKEYEENNRLFGVIQKLTALTAIGVGSTLIGAILVGVFSIPILWVSVDNLFNVISVLLIFKWNEKYYQFWCFWIRYCKCCKCCK